MRTDMQQQQAAINLRYVPSQGGGIPEDSLDQVFQYGYTTVDEGDLSTQVVPIRHSHTPMQRQWLSDLSEITGESALHSAGAMQLISSLKRAEESSGGSILVALEGST